MEKDKVVNEEVHRIRITLVSTNVKAVEKGRSGSCYWESSLLWNQASRSEQERQGFWTCAYAYQVPPHHHP
mgnify:FL=1